MNFVSQPANFSAKMAGSAKQLQFGAMLRAIYCAILAGPAYGKCNENYHPSGDLQPSEADRHTHDQLTEAAKILGLRVLDHVIVTKKGHFSFQEAGLIKN